MSQDIYNLYHMNFEHEPCATQILNFVTWYRVMSWIGMRLLFPSATANYVQGILQLSANAVQGILQL